MATRRGEEGGDERGDELSQAEDEEGEEVAMSAGAARRQGWAARVEAGALEEASGVERGGARRWPAAAGEEGEGAATPAEVADGRAWALFVGASGRA